MQLKIINKYNHTFINQEKLSKILIFGRNYRIDIRQFIKKYIVGKPYYPIIWKQIEGESDKPKGGNKRQYNRDIFRANERTNSSKKGAVL